MAEKVGGIEYDIDVNTGQVKKATGDVSASARAIEASFDKVDKAAAKTKASFSSLNQTYSNNKKEVLDFIASQVKAGRSIDENGNVITAYGVKAKGLTEELNRLNNKFKDSASDAKKVDAAFDALTREKKELIQETKEVTKAIESQNAAIKKSNPAIENQAKKTSTASKNMGSIGRSAGQASIQIQQFTGQLSGGVNPLVAFSQQAADLGIVLGAPLIGSIVGIGAALAINFVPNLADAKSNVELLEESLGKLEGVAVDAGGGILSLSEDIKKLSKESQILARAKIELGIAEAQDAIQKGVLAIKDTLGDGISFSIAEYDKLGKQLASGEVRATEAIVNSYNRRTAKLMELGKDFGLTGQKAIDFGQAIGSAYQQLGKTPSADDITRFSERLLMISGSVKDLPKDARVMIEQLISIASSTSEAGAKADLLTQKLKELKSGVSEIGDVNLGNVEKVLLSLTQQTALMSAELNNGEQAARRLAIAHSLGLETAAEIPPEIRKQIDAMEAVESKQIQMQEAEKARMIEQAELQKKISDETREYELANKKTLSQADALMDSLRTGGMSELEKIQEDFEAKRELLLENEAILLGDKTLSDDEKIALERRTSEALVDIEYQAAKAREAILEREKQAKLNAVKSTFSNLSTLMNTESKKLFEIGKAASIANAIVAGYEAVSKTMASIPYPYNIPLAVAQAAASAAQVQGIAKQKVGGAGGGANTFSGGLPATRTTSADMGQNNNRNITVSGIDANSLISGGQLIRLLEEYIGDGGTVSFAGGG